MRSDREERIKERAYAIWLAEGRVHGHHQEHWHRAEREIAAEETVGQAAGGETPRRTRRTRAAGGGRRGGGGGGANAPRATNAGLWRRRRAKPKPLLLRSDRPPGEAQP